MKKTLHIFIILSLITSISFAKEERSKKNKKSKKSIIQLVDSFTFEDIEKLKDSFNTGSEKSLNKLIAIYQDPNQSISIRLAALEAVENSQDINLKIALEEIIQNADFLIDDLMKKSLYILIKMDDTSSTDAIIEGLKKSEDKIIDLRTIMVDAVGENNTEDKIITLLELYEVSASNHQRMNELLTLSLGDLDDERAMPILMDIARDNSLKMSTRNRAIEILSRKNSPELVDFFVEILGDPNSNDSMQEFINNSMGLENRDRMVMALLESYQIGKTRYHAMLYSIIEGLEDYNNPQMKPLFLEVAQTEGFPKGLRIKAIQSLANFNDETVLNDLINMLESHENYQFYYEIYTLAEKLNANQSYINKIRQAGFNAMKN
tara:strand:- start:1425 stop:2555 length:1131 start_codon:yes stop_codon:yes gene_type:complete